MKPNMRIGIGALLAAMLLISMAFAGAADSSKDLQNESQLHDEKLPDFGPEVFDEIKKDPKVIETRGTIPRFETEEERREWIDKLDENAENVRSWLHSYFHPDGHVIAYGYNYRGYLEVIFLEGSDINEPLMDEIYEIFDQQGKKMGIQEVPLVFHFEEFPEEEGRTSKWRPIIGGIQLQSSGPISSTLSFAAKDRDTGTLGYVMSGHAAVFAGGIGGQIYQPTVSIFNKIGTVDAIGGTYADAGWVEYDNVEPTIYAFDTDITKPVVSYMDPELNWFVYKSGITTWTTFGAVTGVYKEVNSPTFGTLYDQCYANYDCATGDSGAPVFHLDGNANVELLGVHLGHLGETAYFSPISGVYLDLGVVPLTS